MPRATQVKLFSADILRGPQLGPDDRIQAMLDWQRLGTMHARASPSAPWYLWTLHPRLKVTVARWVGWALWYGAP